jgi:hypothetical protein
MPARSIISNRNQMRQARETLKALPLEQREELRPSFSASRRAAMMTTEPAEGSAAMAYSRYSDIDRLMTAVRTIARLGWKYKHEDVAAALMKYCSPRERGDAAFAGSFLTDLWELNRKAEEGVEKLCCECGTHTVDEWKGSGYARSDSRYCSAKCRQKAYRKRVTAERSAGRPRRNVRRFRDASTEAPRIEP